MSKLLDVLKAKLESKELEIPETEKEKKRKKESIRRLKKWITDLEGIQDHQTKP